MPSHTNWIGIGKTDIGLVRSINQDAYAINQSHNLFAIADGMGGHPGGDVASRIAIDSVTEFFGNREERSDNVQPPPSPNETDVYKAIQHAQDRVLAQARINPNLSGMGTTLVVLHIFSNGLQTATVGHIGDSRAYVFRRNELIPLTRDHSLMERYVHEGKILPHEADSHPGRHILTQAIGLEEGFHPTISHFPIKTKDLFLLCTDGLTKMLRDDEIAEILRTEGNSMEKMTEALISHALDRGGDDNVSVILCTSA